MRKSQASCEVNNIEREIQSEKENVQNFWGSHIAVFEKIFSFFLNEKRKEKRGRKEREEERTKKIEIK